MDIKIFETFTFVEESYAIGPSNCEIWIILNQRFIRYAHLGSRRLRGVNVLQAQ